MLDTNRFQKTLYFYRVKFRSKVERFNRNFRLADYFGPLIGDKKHVKIADLGAGPVSTTGNSWPGATVEIYASDVLWNEYEKFWERAKLTPIVPIKYEDMEHLTYPDDFFDIVLCINTLDHTLDARQAVKEMIRVCKKGGYVYMRHAPDQRKRYRGMHEYDINLIDGKCALTSAKEQFFLKDLADFKDHVEKGEKGEDLIVSVYHKV